MKIEKLKDAHGKNRRVVVLKFDMSDVEDVKALTHLGVTLRYLGKPKEADEILTAAAAKDDPPEIDPGG